MAVNWFRLIRAERLALDPHCWYCGDRLTRQTATLDHVVPRSKGGRVFWENLLLACSACNQVKGDHPIETIVCKLPRGSGIVRLETITIDGRDCIMERTKKVGFNYEVVDKSNRDKVYKHTEAIHQLREKGTRNVVEIGHRLHLTRELLGPRFFAVWLKTEFRWSRSVASNYMAITSRFGLLDCLNKFDASALYVLVRKNVPEAAQNDAIERARSGAYITRKLALQILGAHMPASPVPASDDTSRMRTVVQRYAEKLGADRVIEQLQALITQLKARIEVPPQDRPKNSGPKPEGRQNRKVSLSH